VAPKRTFQKIAGRYIFTQYAEILFILNCHSTTIIFLFFIAYRYCSISVFSAQFPLTVENQVQNVDVSEAAAVAAETSEVNVAENEPYTAAATSEVNVAENEPQTAAAAATSEVSAAENEPQTFSESSSASSETEEDDSERICTFQMLALFDRNGQRAILM
jgi:hypothetical protein